MGGTRFIGKSLVRMLKEQGHQLTLFTRGLHSVPIGVEHVVGDRKNDIDLKKLSGRKYDVIIDTSGRNLQDTQRVISQTGHPLSRFLYISSAGVYQKSEILPIEEHFPIDGHSRHIGKALTENWLREEGIKFTSFRPTYIYGPGNYNPIEKWFFDRIIHNRPIPIPDSGDTITQLGHVYDLSRAMIRSLQSDIAINKIYNCSGKKSITFRGLASVAAKACQKDPNEVELKSFNPNSVDSKARKSFPLRIENFFTDISLAELELDWKETFDVQSGFNDSFKNDYLINRQDNIDFSSDDQLIG